MNEINYYEECSDIDEADALVQELCDQYPEDDGWSHDYALDIRHDYVAVHFEAWRD